LNSISIEFHCMATAGPAANVDDDAEEWDAIENGAANADGIVVDESSTDTSTALEADNDSGPSRPWARQD
jgi:hypothetical protein